MAEDKQNSGGANKEGQNKEPELVIIEEGQEGYDAERAAGRKAPAQQARSQADDDDDGGEAGDQRLGHEPGAGEDGSAGDGGEGGDDQAQLTARQRRRRREAAQRASERGELERLRRDNAALQERLGRTDARIANIETTSIDGQIEQIELELRRASTVMSRAMAAQNGEDFEAALNIRDTLRDRLTSLKAQKTAQDKGADRGRQDDTTTRRGGGTGEPRGGVGMTPSQLTNARIFMSRHPWYNPAATDGDSAIVTSIDDAMMAERAMSPSNADYWQELEARIYEELPNRKPRREPVTVDADGGQGGDKNGGQRRNGKAGGPKLPGGGGSGGGGGGNSTTFHLSAARKQSLIDLGVYDNPEERNKYIRRFMQWDKDNANTGA